MIIAAFTIIGPLTAALLAPVFRRWAAGIALGGTVTSLIAAIITLWRVAGGRAFSATLPGVPDLPLRLATGHTSALLAAVVATVSTFVVVYAVGYMAREDGQPRFFAGMAFFTGAMQLLVLAADWILLLAAWELIALASWFLIGFWYERPGVPRAASWAFVITRAADVGLYIGAIALITATGTNQITAAVGLSGSTATIAGSGFLLAAIGKSAQIPLQGWLQEAMAGPTPVSALLHAATLVIAGVILLIRAFPFMPAHVLLAVGLVGGATAVVTGIAAIAQADLKRLLAASTSSQLGLMFLAVGAGSVPAALVHLIAHAAMKSSLFLAAGIFQHDRASTTFGDLRGAGRQRPLVFTAVAIAGLALAGMPPLAGFWSKDAVIAASVHGSWPLLLGPLAVLGSLLTGVYVARALRLLWQGDGTAWGMQDGAAVVWMGTGLAVLVLFAAGLGLAIDPIARLLDTKVPESLPSTIVGTVAAVAGLLAGWFLPLRHLFGRLWYDASDGFRIDGGWSAIVVRPSMALAKWCDRIDRDIHAGVHGVGRGALALAGRSDSMDAGVHDVARRVGETSLGTAHASHALDTDGIDGLIAALVSGTRSAGRRARQLQTGLVHRELLVAVAGGAALLILILLL